MDSKRSWFKVFHQKTDKEKNSPLKKKETENAKHMEKAPVDPSATPSNATKQKVAAAKEYIENHYKAQMKSLQERKER